MKFLKIVCLSALTLLGCSKRIPYTVSHQEIIPIQNIKGTDSSLFQIVAPYKVNMEGIMLQKIGFCKQTLTKKQTESTLGNWVCDAMQFFINDSLKIYSDFSIVNFGGIRVNQIDSGIIYLKTIYELMPFDNTLVLVELDSAGLNLLLNHMSKFRGWPQSKELRYVITHDTVPTQITIHHRPINNQTTYKILLSDYIYNGGDQVTFLSRYKANLIPITLRDALIYAVIHETNKNQSITSTIDHRVLIK